MPLACFYTYWKHWKAAVRGCSSTQVISCKYCKIFKSNFFYKTHPLAERNKWHDMGWQPKVEAIGMNCICFHRRGQDVYQNSGSAIFEKDLWCSFSLVMFSTLKWSFPLRISSANRIHTYFRKGRAGHSRGSLPGLNLRRWGGPVK